MIKVVLYFALGTGLPRQPRMPRIGPCQVLAATLTLSQPGGQIMPTLYWDPWLAKICHGGPGYLLVFKFPHRFSRQMDTLVYTILYPTPNFVSPDFLEEERRFMYRIN